jgi:hypothetical protein
VTEFIYEGKCNNCGRLNPRMAIAALRTEGMVHILQDFGVLIVLRLSSHRCMMVRCEE